MVAAKKHCSETYLPKLGVVQSVDWVFIIGVLALH
jgi:hypothetical protein